MEGVKKAIRETVLRGGAFVVLFALILACMAGAASAATAPAAGREVGPLNPMVRLKDLVNIEGVRGNQLVGIGLVTGLMNTGDKGDLAQQMMANMSLRYGMDVDLKKLKSKNVAVVTVTAELPPFSPPGTTVDVTVSAAGDAKSLEGGVLLQTPLKAANGKVYAVAQGPLMLGGFGAGGESARTRKNVTTVGRVPGGAFVETDVPMGFARNGKMSLILKNPDFTTASRVARVINEKFGNVSHVPDAGRVDIALPAGYQSSPSAFIASIEGLAIRPDTTARVIINERTGTVVMGGNVRLSAAAVAHGNLFVQVTDDTTISQPTPFSRGRTAGTTDTTVETSEGNGQLVLLPTTATVLDLVEAVNAVGASPRDLISILQAIEQSGALHGDLVIQ